jgi:Fe-S oxidoreductase
VTYTAALFLAAVALSLSLFAFFVTRRVQYLLLGRPERRLDHPGRRLAGLLVFVFGQRKVLKEPVGLIHFVIFWGFIVIAFGALQIIGEGLHVGFSLPVLGGSRVFYLLQDVFVVLVLLAVLAAAFIRYVVRPQRLTPNFEAAAILALIGAIMVAILLYGGTSEALAPSTGRSLAYVTRAVASAVDATGWSAGTLRVLQHTWWWLHLVLILGFLVYIPLSKHLHLLACPFNEYLRNLKPRGAQIERLDLESEEVEEFGVSRIEGFTRKQLLDLYACAECGRCQDNCPAFLSDKSLSPKVLIHDLKGHLLERGAELKRGARAARATRESPFEPGGADKLRAAPASLIGDVIAEEEIWACTTCYSCQEQCPVQNEHVNKIIDLRRHLVLDRADFPQEAQLACRNVEKNGNPWGLGASAMPNWAGEGVAIAGQGELGDYLYWVGCAGTYDDRNVKVTRAVMTLLRAAGVSFSVLRDGAQCCGDPMRRMGNEYLFQMLAQANVKTLNSLGVTKIVTHCPHCLNTLRHEYPVFGGHYEVVHHTEVLAELLAAGRLQLSDGGEERVAYHDSCYLGRYQGQYEAPRQVLRAVPELTLLEAQRNRAKSFCCGAGGGRMWMEESGGQRINGLRVRQLLETQPTIIGVNCPYCLTMMEDGLGSVDGGSKVKALDLAEILAARVQGLPGRGAVQMPAAPPPTLPV